MADPTRSHPPPRPRRLKDLPPEILEMIFEAALINKRNKIKPWRRGNNRPGAVPGLLGVSQWVRSEALRIYYSKTSFVIKGDRETWLWMRHIGSEGRQHLGHLTVRLTHNTIWGGLLMPLLADCKNLNTLGKTIRVCDILIFVETDSFKPLHAVKEASFEISPGVPIAQSRQLFVYQGRQVSMEEINTNLLNFCRQLESVYPEDPLGLPIKQE